MGKILKIGDFIGCLRIFRIKGMGGRINESDTQLVIHCHTLSDHLKQPLQLTTELSATSRTA